MRTLVSFGIATVALLGATAGNVSAAASPESATSLDDTWTWRVAPYAWFPDVRASTRLQVPGRGTLEVDVRPDDYLSDLQFAFMGTVEARRGRWSVVVDAVHFDFDIGRAANASVAAPDGSALPVLAEVQADLQGLVGAVGVGYSLMEAPGAHVDVIGGVRYLRLESSLAYALTAAPGIPVAAGDAARTRSFTDGVVGLRGRASVADDWFVPFHVDVGTGESRLTWQAFVAIGYRFRWGEVVAGYRHVAYEFDKDRPVVDLSLSGPLVGVAFRF